MAHENLKIRSYVSSSIQSMMRQFQDMEGSFSIGLREPRGVSLLSYQSTQAHPSLVSERASHPPSFPDFSMDCLSLDDDLLKSPLGKVESIEN